MSISSFIRRAALLAVVVPTGLAGSAYAADPAPIQKPSHLERTVPSPAPTPGPITVNGYGIGG